MSKSKILKIILVVTILVAIFWGSNTVENYFRDIMNYITTYMDGGGTGGMTFFIALSILSVMLVSFSSIWLVPIAVSIWGNTLTLVFLLGGWFLGSIFSYLIGRYAGYPIVRKIISSKKLDNYNKVLAQARESFGLIVLSRFILPSEIPGYLLGIIKYPFARYLIATLIGEIPYALATVYFIDAILRKDVITFLIWGVIWISFALITVRMYRKITNNQPPTTNHKNL